MEKYEIKIDELKKEFTEEEAEALALEFCSVLDCIHIEHGATPIEKARAKRTRTAEALGDLFGLPYISNSVHDKAAAIWNTNTSAELLGVDGFKFLGLAIGNGGEFVGLFQEHNESGEEVGEVRCLILSNLLKFIADKQKSNHEAERVANLENINQFRKTAREILPKACAILEKYRGKRWGDTTRGKIWDELRTLTADGVTVSASWGSYWLDLEIFKNRNCSGLAASFSWRFDNENNTPAEEITPTAKHFEKLANINIKEHRRELVATVEEIEKTAEKLKKLIETYNNEARGKGYQKAESLSAWGLNLADLTSRELDR
jgi:hypothetical protein